MMKNWKTKDGRIILISEMTDTHLLNSIRYVERKIEANANGMFLNYDPMMVPDKIKQDSARLFEAAKRQDRGWMALMEEAVRRKLLMWDGSPAPWEKSPFSPPAEEKKKETSREVRVVKQQISASKMDRLKAEAKKDKKNQDLQELSIGYEDKFVSYLLSKYESGLMQKLEIRESVLKLQGVVADGSFIRLRDRVGRGVMEIDRAREYREQEAKTRKARADIKKIIKSRGMEPRNSYIDNSDSLDALRYQATDGRSKKEEKSEAMEWKPGKRRIVVD